jgi:hypothetical protein
MHAEEYCGTDNVPNQVASRDRPAQSVMTRWRAHPSERRAHERHPDERIEERRFVVT